jgi:hypothetical protein
MLEEANTRTYDAIKNSWTTWIKNQGVTL